MMTVFSSNTDQNSYVNQQRKHYMTLCFRGNTEVTHIVKNGKIEVTFEQAVNGGFNTLITDLQGNVIQSSGFTDNDVDFFCRFVRQSADGIKMESDGVI